MSNTDATFDSGTTDVLVDAERLPAGTQFGSYRIKDVIGAGAMGTVYRAEHDVLGKQVALKLMAPALRNDTEARHRFLLEAKTTAAIKHRHVIEIVDFGECGGNPYIVMELLEGEDLERHLETRTRLSSPEAASLLLPIVAALAAAHDAGVVHRDLKPSNIFLHREPDGTLVPKLLDFGISKQTLAPSRADFQTTSWNQLLGSPHYWPPEAVHGCRDLTPRSDQYSFGVVLYESVTGRAPIERKTWLELLNAIARAEFSPPSHGLPELAGPMESSILRCMQRDPAARFADVRELGRALLELADERTRMLWGRAFDPPTAALVVAEPLRRVSSRSPTLPPRRRTAGSSRRQLLSLAAASACVLGVAGVALLAAAPPAPAINPPEPAASRVAPPLEAAPSLAAALPAAASPAAPSGAPPPTAAPQPRVAEQPPTPDPVAQLSVNGKADDAEPDSGDTKSLAASAQASDEATSKPTSRPAARPKRRIKSPQRPPRFTLAARARENDPSLHPDVVAADPDGASSRRRPDPQGREPTDFGANESPIFD